MFAIHNLSHQGVEPAATFPNLGLPDDWCASGFASHGMTGSVSFQHPFSYSCSRPVLLSAPLSACARLLWLLPVICLVPLCRYEMCPFHDVELAKLAIYSM